jgi:hypothetical protein
VPRYKLDEGGALHQWLLPSILASKAIWTVIVLVLVARVTPLRDAEYYLSFTLSSAPDSPFRTILLGVVAHFIRDWVGSDAIVHLAFSLAVGVAFWWLLRDRELQGKAWLLLLLLALPASGIWGSMVSKEVFSIIASVVFFRFLLRGYEGERWLLPCLTALAAVAFFRYHYAIGLAWLVFVLVFITTMENRPIAARWILICIVVLAAMLFFIEIDRINGVIDSFVIPLSRAYIIEQGSANLTRSSLVWEVHRDFWENLWWGVPFGIVGLLPDEIAGRPERMAMFVGGMMTLAVYVACFTLAWRRLADEPKGRLFFIFGLIPAAFVTLLAHYPISVLNPGSGIRYHVAFSVQMGFGMLAFACLRRKRT